MTPFIPRSKGHGFSSWFFINWLKDPSQRLSFYFYVKFNIIACLFAKNLMLLFIKSGETKIILSGVHYLPNVAVKPLMSLVLTIISLGLRVVLAYSLAPFFHETGIWISIPIGWLIADIFGFLYYFKHRSLLLKE